MMSIMMRSLLPIFVAVTSVTISIARIDAGHPNIVYVLADDMGYGDVAALNPQCKIKTPNLDKLAAGGMVFSDAHSSSSVCTPTRYGLLTGRYNWRSRLKQGVLYGYDRRLIEADRLTVPAMLREQGYHTACVGKWHLGWDWPLKDGGIANGDRDADTVDFAKPITNGPNSVGFDYFFGIAASLDMPPYVYIENDRCTEQPTLTIDRKEFGRGGLAVPGLTAAQVLPDLTSKSVDYIRSQTRDNRDGQPFFLYFPLPAPHTPIAPTKDWQGKSGISKYCDFVMQVDDTVGQVMSALDEADVTDNTLFIFTADNGCSPAANIPEMHRNGHRPNHHFRGHKADIFDGGHRVPFIARWPESVKAGSKSDQLICLTDLMATTAQVTGIQLPDDAGEDSVSYLPALLGTDSGPLREAVVHHSIRGAFSIRRGDWKLELCPGSGGWSHPKPGSPAAKKLPPIQLYNMKHDVGETKNVHAEHPEVVAELTELLQSHVDRGRSTPGADQANNGAVHLRPQAKQTR
jgi:arylsulfatase A-like enzyme